MTQENKRHFKKGETVQVFYGGLEFNGTVLSIGEEYAVVESIGTGVKYNVPKIGLFKANESIEIEENYDPGLPWAITSD